MTMTGQDRTALPREYDQGTGERRRMVNPALDICSHAPLKLLTVCCVQHCGRAASCGTFCVACFEEYSALNEMWAAKAARKADPAYRVRRAAFWRFINSFMVMMAFELLLGYCLNVLDVWQIWALSIGWALIVAVVAAFFGGAKKVRGTDV